MRLAISNIAWRPEEDSAVAFIMAEHHVTRLEVAPTVMWPNPLAVAMPEALTYRRWWEDRGITIVAMQALLYGRSDLTIFGTESARLATLDYLTAIVRLGGWLGATRLVLGSPANRRVGDLASEERQRIAVEFFRRAGHAALENGTTLCLEPNPPQYACDFVNSAREARDLIGRVGSTGFGLHLDSGAMTLQGEAPDEVTAGELPLHFHISEPFLARLGSGETNHAGFVRVLSAGHYGGVCSIEARRPTQGSVLDEVSRNLAFAAETYGLA